MCVCTCHTCLYSVHVILFARMYVIDSNNDNAVESVCDEDYDDDDGRGGGEHAVLYIASIERKL